MLPGIRLITPMIYPDERGTFQELWNEGWGGFAARQVSESWSRLDVLRGLHFQVSPKMGKAIRVVKGSIFLVNVDVNSVSSTFGYYWSIVLSAENAIMCYAPAHYARGFVALEEDTGVEYFHDTTHSPDYAFTIAWNDPDIGIQWPVWNPILSAKDERGMSLQEWAQHPCATYFTRN